MKHISLKNKYEVLAPAGSYQCMVAAFNAGADAVYVGGRAFGARAFAGNFNDEELLKAIDYAHIRGKKLFLTVNTLLKDSEIEEQLYDYIKTFYEAGLDAVIVQDFGVLEFIYKNFPNMDIHASTQMTVTGSSFAKKLKEYGVTRIVPARELSISEIKDIYEKTNLEIETFVHGALCYSYSGQCLFSSIIGGRSGNRGRCAQPCRLPYDIIFDNKTIQKEYPLSPKDLCTLSILPDILEAGIYSLKIEGRMKKPEYVASVVAMYRKYVDLYVEHGRAGYIVNADDIKLLKEIYNRGGFTDGYFKKHNSKDIMSLDRPNHMGIPVAKILSYNKKNGIIRAKALENIDKSDVLEIFTKTDDNVYVSSVNVSKNDEFTIKDKLYNIGEQTYIMRTRNNLLIKSIEDKYLSDKAESKVYIGGNVTISQGSPIYVSFWSGDVSVTVEGTKPDAATNRPLTLDDVRKQFLKTGGTDFIVDENDFSVSVDDGLFVTVGELNSLRRSALEQLKVLLLKIYKRECINKVFAKDDMMMSLKAGKRPIITALATTLEQFNTLVNNDKVSVIYAESDINNCLSNKDLLEDSWLSIIDTSHNHNKEIYMALPYIARNQLKELVMNNLNFFKGNQLDGYLFRNLEEVALFDELSIDKKKIVFDNHIYSFNKHSINFLNRYNPYLTTASYELNNHELMELCNDKTEICIYGHIPVMITAGCIKKSYDRCNKKSEKTILKDRMANDFTVINNCNYCYNIIYNSKPLKLYDILDKSNKIVPAAYRYNFTIESESEVSDILNGYDLKDFTRGHFKRGVD